MRRIFLIFLAIIFFSLPVEAGILQGIGANLGVISGAGSLGDSLNLGFEGNLFLETSKFLLPLEIGLGIIYQTKREAEQTTLWMFPITLSYLKHFSGSPKYSPFVKLGAGVALEKVSSPLHTHTNSDPAFVASLGLESRIGKKISLRTELSYRFILQRYIEEARYNGHFISFCVGIIYE